MAVEVLSRKNFIAALRRAGIREGDVVHVQSDLRTPGPVEASPAANPREAILEFYLAGFREALGPSGTLTVLTSFEDYGRFGTPFVREESPSRAGAFSEYMRTQPGAVRSVHPIVSLTGLGERAEELCGGNHYDGYGYDSPWGRLHRLNAKFVSLGIGMRIAFSFQHYIEKQFGIPYQYTKLYRTPVYSNGREVPGPFTMSVRYLDFGIAYDFSRFEKRLLEKGAAVEVALGRAMLQLTTAQPALDVGMACLNEDRYFFLKTPPTFRDGEFPLDGFTGPEKYMYDRGKNDAPRAEEKPHG